MPDVYKSMGVGFSIASKEGALTIGWLPTLIGYSAQGLFKFGFYEIFKVCAVFVQMWCRAIAAPAE
jgi:solute carrier family 25 phosphate transporter 3